MAKDPAFLFYPNDWLGGTIGMTFEEKGAYMELLMMQFNRGHMTTHMIGQVVGQIWDNIQHKFAQDEKGLWYNERLDIEKDRRKAFTESRRNNIKGTNQYTKKEDKNNGHMTSHMENENRNELRSNSNEYNEEFAKQKYSEYTTHLRKQSVYERLGMNLNIKPTDILHVINEFIDLCHGEMMEKKTKFIVEQYFMNWAKIDGRVMESINNQIRKNGIRKNTATSNK